MGKSKMNGLKVARIKSGFSQKELATKCGLASFQTISHWESGHSVPSFQNLLRLSEVLECSIDELIKGG